MLCVCRVCLYPSQYVFRHFLLIKLVVSPVNKYNTHSIQRLLGCWSAAAYEYSHAELIIGHYVVVGWGRTVLIGHGLIKLYVRACMDVRHACLPTGNITHSGYACVWIGGWVCVSLSCLPWGLFTPLPNRVDSNSLLTLQSSQIVDWSQLTVYHCFQKMTSVSMCVCTLFLRTSPDKIKGCLSILLSALSFSTDAHTPSSTPREGGLFLTGTIGAILTTEPDLSWLLRVIVRADRRPTAHQR